MIEPIDSHNGVLVLKEATVRHQTDTYNLIVVYNVTKIREIYMEVCRDYYTFNFKNQNLSSYKENVVSRQQIEYLIDVIESKLIYLGMERIGFTEANRSRNKRGLINGLGSIVKAITGNLDQEDAIRFEEQIKEIKSLSLDSEQRHRQTVSLMRDFMMEYNDKLDKINKNQQKLLQAINNVNEKQSIMQATLIYNQVGVCLQQLHDRLLTLENAITFANLGQLHPSVVDPLHLVRELKNVQREIELQIPYTPKLKNIHLLTKAITVKAYSTNESLNFVLEVPLVTNMPYALLHLYSIPNVNDTLLIPKNPYLILGSNEFAYPHEQCLHVKEAEVICRHVEWQSLKKSEDCMAQLVQHKRPHNCTYAKANYRNNIIQQIKENSWIVILKREEVIKSTCGNDVQYQRIKGVAVVSINNQCSVRIGERTLRTHKRYVHVQESIPLPKTYNTPNNFSTKIELEEVKLDSLEDILQKTKEIKEPIYLPPVSSRPSWSSIMLCIIIAAIGASMGVRRYLRHRKATITSATPADIPLQNVRQSSACFALKEGGVTSP